MKNLWAPWRMKYILSEKDPHCIFCKAANETTDRENLVLYRSAHTFVIMNLYPYNNGHLMVVPYTHTSSLLEGLSVEVLSDLMDTTRHSVKCIKAAMAPEGFNIGLNMGKAAGAGIEEHLHMHVVPRWTGDSSFMAIQADIRVVPEHIMDTYDKLHPLLNAKDGQP